MSRQLPVLVTRQSITFPGYTIELDISRKESINAINAARELYENFIILVAQIDDTQTEIRSDNIYNVGILCQVNSVEHNKVENKMIVKLIGQRRISLTNISIDEYVKSETKQFKETMTNSEVVKQKHELIVTFLNSSVDKMKLPIEQDLIKKLVNKTATELIDALAFQLPIHFKTKQKILIEPSLDKRMDIFLKATETFLPNLNGERVVTQEISDKVRNKLSEQQKEFYLREQMKAIKEELEEMNGQLGEMEEIRKRLNENPYPQSIKDKVTHELKRLENTPSSTPEANIIRTYVDWLMELPYWQKTEDKIDIKKAKKLLDQHHYGLNKAKERIIEFLALKQQNPESKGTIICFVGAPGTGKTSLVNSIAEALGKKMVKVSLGGVRDEAEIRGHRRTYIASMPGKIITAMKKAKVVNPIILLDEIDKMSSDYKGDPASAMLEVLDYEQNSKFQDHFIEEEYDLSNVMFIATANYLENIPAALHDRLELIEVSSYTELEKINIAKLHLIPRVLKETKIEPSLFEFDDESLKFVIRHYTMEAGVRQLYRVLEQLARKIIVQKLDKKLKSDSIKFDSKLVVKLLGKEKFDFTKKEKEPQVGTTMGLAWTAYGGDILPIEVTLYPGKGNVILTGNQKEIMKESATIALSFVKANAKEFGIKTFNDKNENIFTVNDFHIHVPDGATPKDGPSAGVTFTTAIISAITKKPVSQLLGMTGEITLRGKVSQIGGLKEKSISAYRSGLKEIFIPKENEKDLVDIPQEVKDNLKITPVERYESIYSHIFK